MDVAILSLDFTAAGRFALRLFEPTFMADPGHLVLYPCFVAEQAIRFTEDRGRRIAWTQTGEGPPLVFAGWWMSHLELNWRDPRFRAFVDALGEHRTVIRYDAPGIGDSAEDALPSPNVEAEMTALAAVIDAAGADSVDLLAASSGGPVGIAYATANPERVQRLVLYGSYASGSGIADPTARRMIVEMVREHWGLGSRVLADVFMPSADANDREAFVEYQREAASAERAARSLEAVYSFDVSAILDRVRAPAVALHRREDRAIPFELGRELAAGLPEASFVALDGADHYPWFGDTGQLLGAILRALEVEEPAIVLAAPDRRTPTAEDSDLTRRETEVLGLIASGLSDREIAERLVLSPHTVHRHVANVRTKLGLSTRAAAVAAASKRGLL
jgi:pimeloyl-ACP methyl ester carboxylesterase/DNA-binding CsgD family transcriptional regulator